MKRNVKRLLLFLIAIALFYTMPKVFADNTKLEEVRLSSVIELESLEEGELPTYTISTTTEHVVVEPSGWAKLPGGANAWVDIEGESPTAEADGAFYAMKITITADDQYEIDDNTKIFYKDRDMSDTYTSVILNDTGAIVYLDFGQIGTNNPDPGIPKQSYNVSTANKDALALFNDFEGHNFVLDFIDILKLSPETIENDFGVPASYIEQAVASIKKNTQKYGNLLSVYAIEIHDGGYSYSDALTLKIKMSGDMNKYNSFKFIFLDENNEFKVKEIHNTKTETINGEKYIVVDLKHLSAYALIGNNVSSTNNPQTGDNVLLYIAILGISILGIATTTIYQRKKYN